VDLVLGLMMERLSSARTGAVCIAAARCTTITNTSTTTTAYSHTLRYLPAVVFHCYQQLSLSPIPPPPHVIRSAQTIMSDANFLA
jgi:hypothetical protein